MKKPKILCVQHHQENCQILNHFLSKKSYEIVSAHTFVEGLTKVLAERFDAILLDSRLPDGSGIELCRQIRAVNKQTPFIFYSADVFPYQVEKAIQAGGSLYLKQ